jgi:hypothetical protein
MPKRKAPGAAPADPDRLVRQAAGNYRTADDRFEVRETAGEWFIVDTRQANEFGQELMRGPFATLKAVRTELPNARQAKATPMRRRPRPRAVDGGADDKADPPPPPPSWIDLLPRADAARVRLLIRALESEGLDDAEATVRRDRDGLAPVVATRLIERRLDAIVDELPPKERRAARDVVRRVVELLAGDGGRAPEPLPGWSLVEIGPEPEPPNRRIDLGD